jgi:hypothetical protein
VVVAIQLPQGSGTHLAPELSKVMKKYTPSPKADLLDIQTVLSLFLGGIASLLLMRWLGM